jgi:prepilin-type N-terminal cleavage/methylation domain-containing protein
MKSARSIGGEQTTFRWVRSRRDRSASGSPVARSAPCRDQGFTVVELVVASAILLVASTGVLTSLTFAATTTAMGTVRTEALNLASQQLEQARNLPYDDVGIRYANGTYGDPAGSIPATQTSGRFGITTQVSWTRDPSTGESEYKNIGITVSWTSPQQGSVYVASSIFGASALINIGDLSVTVTDRDSNLPISGASVLVTPAGGTTQRVVSTDASGSAFFGALPLGTTGVAVSAVSTLGETYVFEPVATTTIGPALLASDVVYGHLPSSIAVSVVDTGGAAVTGSAVTLTSVSSGQVTTQKLASGSYTFTGLLPGNYTLTATESGYYNSQVCSIAVGPSAPGGRKVSQIVVLRPMPPPCTLKVFAKTASGVAIAGAMVHVTGPAPASTDATGSPQSTSSGSGEADFVQLTAGTYTVTATLANYTTVAWTGPISAGQTVSITLVMSSTGELDVTAKNPGGVALSGVAVTMTGPSNQSGTTSSSGVVKFPGSIVGTYTITGTLTGYTTGTWTGTLAAGQIVPVTLVMTNTGELDVTAKNSSGVALSGVTVTVTGPTNASGTTNSSGAVKFTGLLAGSYTVKGTLWNYTTATWTGTLSAGQVVPVPLIMATSR